MTSLDHNCSRFGFSATRARLPVPRARLDKHDETSWTRPPSEEQPRVGFQSALTPVIHRHESHTPPNSSIQTKSFAAAQPPWRQLDQPDSEEGACSPSWHWRCRWPCSLITGRGDLCSRFRGVHASSCVSFRALRRRINLTQRFHPDAQDPSPSATLEILSLAFTVHSYAPPPPPRRSPARAPPHSLAPSLLPLRASAPGEVESREPRPGPRRCRGSLSQCARFQRTPSLASLSSAKPAPLSRRSLCGIVDHESRDIAPSLLSPACI